MNCPKCGAALKDQARSCPACGQVLEKKKQGNGFKILFVIALVVCAFILWHVIVEEEPADVVKEQIQALHDNKITEAYYAFTSREFQKETSLEKFKEFVKSYPFLTSIQSADLTIEDGPENDIKIIEGTLIGPNQTSVPVEYEVILEDSKWKILFIKFVKTTPTKEAESSNPKNMSTIIAVADDNKPNIPKFSTKDIMAVIEGQLQALKQGEIGRAYFDFTSEKYRQSVDYGQFSQFVNNSPVLIFNKSASFDELKFENDIAKLSVNLTSTNGISRRVEYDLAFENGQWKILKISLANHEGGITAQEKFASKLEFDKIILGTQIDDSGNILDPGTNLKAHQSEIYANLFIKSAAKGDIIQVEFEYVENGTRVPVMAYTIPSQGDQKVTFSFSPPPAGWPKGNYHIKVASLTGAERVFPFTIE